MRNLRLVMLVLGAVALVTADAPNEIIDKAGDYAQINWTKGVIVATGLGPLPRSKVKNLAIQRRVATIDAYRHLGEAVHGVLVTSETTVEMYELTQDTIRASMSAFIKGQTAVSEGWLDDGETYRVTMQAPIAQGDKDSVAAIVLPVASTTKPADVIKQVEEKNKTLPEAKQVELPPKVEKPVDIPVKPPAPKDPIPERKPGPYTGLVVDGSGFKLERAMAPKIVKGDESEVWGTVQVSREFVLDTGIVGYMPSLEMACNPDQSRAGKNPLVVRAIGRHGSFRANAVISDADAALVMAENQKTKFLDKFKVVFVVDPK